MKADDEARQPVIVSFSIVGFAVSLTVAVLVTCTYWAFLYEASHGITVQNLLVHGVQLGILLLDALLTLYPSRIVHCIYPMMVACVYVIFTVVYWACGGRNRYYQRYLYKILDYTKDPCTAITVALVLPLVVIPLAHWILYVPLYLKYLVYNSCSKRCRAKVSTAEDYEAPVLKP
eukprot:Filipodium_phascolosomae@DN556_c0_g1_i1.p1